MKSRNRKKQSKKSKKSNKSKKSKTLKKWRKWRKWRGGEFDDVLKNTISQSVERKDENLSRMLQVTCKNADNCIALGPYNAYIKYFFKNFTDLSQIDIVNIKRVGRPSKNGFVMELPFQRLNYTAYTILKCAVSRTSDNLMYEYYVGKYLINKYIQRLPCFVETYGLYKFKNEQIHQQVQIDASNNTLSGLEISTCIESVDYERFGMVSNIFQNSCQDNQLYCILIQHFDHFATLYDRLTSNVGNVRPDLHNILYQVYYGLVLLGNTYTHYDLHANNVCLYKPFDGKKCIWMRYHSNGRVYEFKSEYIAKIIDYGRNYMKQNEVITTSYIINQGVCQSPQCNPSCGLNYGYRIINGKLDNPPGKMYWINPTKPNVSADLRLAKLYETHLAMPHVVYLSQHGTPEVTGPTVAGRIRNIFDVKKHLEDRLNELNTLNNTAKYDSTWEVVATMDIYDDGRNYEFILHPEVLSPQLNPESQPYSSQPQSQPLSHPYNVTPQQQQHPPPSYPYNPPPYPYNPPPRPPSVPSYNPPPYPYNSPPRPPPVPSYNPPPRPPPMQTQPPRPLYPFPQMDIPSQQVNPINVNPTNQIKSIKDPFLVYYSDKV